ncbi:MAG: galactokinase [Chloroflexota bacterium]|nr:MAG: galactokinase [Chloroflexota bacterium]
MILKDKVIQAFREKYGADPVYLTRSPGRVNIIGEHTDYNDGFVLPMAINFATWIALRPRQDDRMILTALDKNEKLDFGLTGFSKGKGSWREYVKGVAWSLQEEGFELKGWEGVLSGAVPIGAGLSSSAALELALARAFALVSDLAWDPVQMALACQKAENSWVGVNSGIMDQIISASGKKDYALKIDCRSLRTEQVPLPNNTRIVILDTATRRGLLDSAYNERREQCEAAACHFGVKALRDITQDQLEERAGILDLVIYRRAQHVISENQRVLDAVKALDQGDAAALGLLMNESHSSMRYDFEISRLEMDQMVSIAQDQAGCYGARMTGGGFGGCAVALVAEDQIEIFKDRVMQEYRAKTGLDPKVYVSSATDGTGFEVLSNME